MLTASRSLTVLLGAIAALLLTASAALAATYEVTRTDDPVPGPCVVGGCSLREALIASNASTTVDDVIVVPASEVPYEDTLESKPLPIADSVEILGAGADKVRIKGNGTSVVFQVDSGEVKMVGLTISDGEGAIQNNATILTLLRSSIERNERTGGGGGIQTNGKLVVDSSFIGFNVATDISGGGIQANGPVTIRNSTVALNRSKGNSAIKGNGALDVLNSAVLFNTSEGMTSAAASGNPFTVRDSIFAANTNLTGTLSCASLTPIKSLGGNVDDAATCALTAADKPNVAPGVGTLGLFGGTTPVYDLLATSPAIDAATVIGCPPLDQRGVARPVGAACDSGPFEYVPPPPVPPIKVVTPDSSLAMRIGKGKLSFGRKGIVRVALSCPATETAPPCAGTLVLKTRSKVEVGSKRRKLRLAGTDFKVAAGKTKKVALRLPKTTADLVRDDSATRRVLLQLKAKDALGNTQSLTQKRTLIPR